MDIKLDDLFRITAAKTGDVPVTTNEVEVLLQDIRLEALTQEGELFYAEDYGWSLLDYMHREVDELDKMELTARIRKKLAAREQIDAESITVSIEKQKDEQLLRVRFALVETENAYQVEVGLGRVEVNIE